MKHLGLIAGAALALTTLSAQADDIKVASFTPAGHTITESVLNAFKSGVEGASDAKVEIFLGGELGPGPVEQYVRVLQGVADASWSLHGYTSSQFPRTMLVELPGMVPEGQSGAEKIWSAFETHLAGEYPGTKPLALWTSEKNMLILRDKDVRSPADLEGLKLRVAGSVAAEAATALGAVPVQMPIFEVYNALQTGLIDGVITGGSAIRDFKLHEVADSYTIGAPLGRLAFYFVMSQATYDGLSAEQQAAIDAASGLGLSQSGETAWQSSADEAIAALRADDSKTVIDLSEDEVAAFGAITLAISDAVIAGVDGGAEAAAALRGE